MYRNLNCVNTQLTPFKVHNTCQNFLSSSAGDIHLEKIHTHSPHHHFRWESFLNKDKIHTVHYNGKTQEFIVSHTSSHRKDTILIPS